MSLHRLSFPINSRQTLQIEIDYTPGTPAQLSGPPEDCTPEDPPEILINQAELRQYTRNGSDLVIDVYDLLDFLGAEDWLIQRCFEALSPPDDEPNE